jgi:hypothetical protein
MADQGDNSGQAAQPERTGLWRWSPAAVVIVFVLAYLVLVPVGVIAKDDRLGTTEAILVAALLVVFVFLAQTTYTVRGLSIGASGLVADFERIEARQDVLEAEIRALQVSLTGLVTKFELVHLQKLAADGPAVVTFSEIMVRELEHLDALEFVFPTDVRGINAIREDYGGRRDDFDLNRYVEITRGGREYLALRARLAARTASRQAAAVAQVATPHP